MSGQDRTDDAHTGRAQRMQRHQGRIRYGAAQFRLAQFEDRVGRHVADGDQLPIPSLLRSGVQQ